MVSAWLPPEMASINGISGGTCLGGGAPVGGEKISMCGNVRRGLRIWIWQVEF